MGNNIIVVFSNRNKSMQFASYLKRLGIPNKTVNTPRELSVSCGLSVVFKSSYLIKVREIVCKLNLQHDINMFVINPNSIKKYNRI